MLLDKLNILKLKDKEFPAKAPKKKEHLFAPIYGLFQRYQPKPAQPEYAFFIDTSICTGCKACEVACKQWNQIVAHKIEWSKDSYDNTQEIGARSWREVKFIERFPETDTRDRPAPRTIPGLLKEKKVGEWLFMSDSCKHCRTSPCHEACPTGAIMRNEFGGIYYQTDICMGCEMCIAACPFGVPELSPNSGHSVKCMECYDRLRDGLFPACETNCVTGAIDFGPRETMVEAARQRVNFLHAHDHPEANLYGVDPFRKYDSLNTFYLLMDQPKIYGLPEDPVLPSTFMVLDYFRGFCILVICCAAIVAGVI